MYFTEILFHQILGSSKIRIMFFFLLRVKKYIKTDQEIYKNHITIRTSFAGKTSLPLRLLRLSSQRHYLCRFSAFPYLKYSLFRTCNTQLTFQLSSHKYQHLTPQSSKHYIKAVRSEYKNT